MGKQARHLIGRIWTPSQITFPSPTLGTQPGAYVKKQSFLKSLGQINLNQGLHSADPLFCVLANWDNTLPLSRTFWRGGVKPVTLLPLLGS